MKTRTFEEWLNETLGDVSHVSNNTISLMFIAYTAGKAEAQKACLKHVDELNRDEEE